MNQDYGIFIAALRTYSMSTRGCGCKHVVFIFFKENAFLKCANYNIINKTRKHNCLFLKSKIMISVLYNELPVGLSKEIKIKYNRSSISICHHLNSRDRSKKFF